MNQQAIEQAVRENLRWFDASGVVDPPDGSWGVAERILLAGDNAALERTLAGFYAHTPKEGYYLLEHRRPDCCFQTALLFLLAGEWFHTPTRRDQAAGIVRYLYYRSAFLNRGSGPFARGAWNWASVSWTPQVYFDDNSWNLVISRIFARKLPELNAELELRKWSSILGQALLEGFRQSFDRQQPAPECRWHGKIHEPHWGALVCMAFAFAAADADRREEYESAAQNYMGFLLRAPEKFSISDCAYALLGAAVCEGVFSHEIFARVRREFSARLRSVYHPRSLLPSEHYETPQGAGLIDLVYTVNWALTAFQCAAASGGEPADREMFERLATRLLEIQDHTDHPWLRGCWRGLYDAEHETWGGGDHHEGGAASIYTGWTNAPISLALLGELTGENLVEFARREHAGA